MTYQGNLAGDSSGLGCLFIMLVLFLVPWRQPRIVFTLFMLPFTNDAIYP